MASTDTDGLRQAAATVTPASTAMIANGTARTPRSTTTRSGSSASARAGTGRRTASSTTPAATAPVATHETRATSMATGP